MCRVQQVQPVSTQVIELLVSPGEVNLHDLPASFEELGIENVRPDSFACRHV